MTKLYVAYGSNLCKAQMRRRCPNSRPLGKFMLTASRLVFRGVADLEYAPGQQTPCGLYLINRDDERSLDRYEGVDAGVYYKTEEIELSYLGERRKALVYLMHSDGIYPPSQTYVDTIRRGYENFGLDMSYLDDAVARSFSDKMHDAQTAARRRRQLDSEEHCQLVAMPESIVQRKLAEEPPLPAPAAKTSHRKNRPATMHVQYSSPGPTYTRPTGASLSPVQRLPKPNISASKSDMDWINEHRQYFGREPFKYLPDHVVTRHLDLIERYAEHGEDPWRHW